MRADACSTLANRFGNASGGCGGFDFSPPPGGPAGRRSGDRAQQRQAAGLGNCRLGKDQAIRTVKASDEGGVDGRAGGRVELSDGPAAWVVGHKQMIAGIQCHKGGVRHATDKVWVDDCASRGIAFGNGARTRRRLGDEQMTEGVQRNADRLVQTTYKRRVDSRA